MPKAINCKAKTADVDQGKYRLAGLVVNPKFHPNAFAPDKQQKAAKCFADMVQAGLIRDGQADYNKLRAALFTTDEDKNSKHYGCLKYMGHYIHGDYDLFDIIPADDPGNNTAVEGLLLGQVHMRGPLVTKVQGIVNPKIGAKMVQHGGQAQYSNDTETKVEMFGPHGENATLLNEHTLREWYKNQFDGRQALVHGKQAPLGVSDAETKRNANLPAGHVAPVLTHPSWQKST